MKKRFSSKALRSNGKKQVGRQSGSFLVWWEAHPLLCFSVVAAFWVLALYGRALQAPFVYDDLDQIVNNPSLHSWHAMFARFFLSPVSFSSDFLAGGGSTYRPVYWTTLMVDRQLWGAARASGFHFTNLLLHWANGVLLFQLLRRLRVASVIAAAASIVWLGLPINTEAVAWVSGRAYLLSGLFILLGLLAASAYLQHRRSVLLGCYVAFSCGALFSHEQGLLLLPLTALLIWIEGYRDRGEWLKLVGFGLIADVAFFVVKYRVGAHAGGGKSALWSVGEVFWKYVQLTVAPLHMSVERSTSLPSDTFSYLAALAWAAMLALGYVAFLLRKQAPVATAGLVCGTLALLPYCGFVFIYQGMAERFVYLASMGFAVAIVSLALAPRARWKWVGVACLLVWVAWSGWRLRSRVADWDDPVALYRNSLIATPKSANLYYNLGFSLRQRGELQDALKAYQETVRLQPGYARAFASIGDIHAGLGEPAEAIMAHDQALRLEPNNAGIMINDAVALEAVGNRQLAESQFKRAVALAPNDSAAYIDLGSLYVEERREDEAIQAFQRAIDLNPQDPNPYYDLAVMFQQTGRDDLALPFYRQVLRLKPDDPDTLFNISKLRRE
jgi:tetratricopeptide (TPR) repeat protein